VSPVRYELGFLFTLCSTNMGCKFRQALGKSNRPEVLCLAHSRLSSQTVWCLSNWSQRMLRAEESTLSTGQIQDNSLSSSDRTEAYCNSIAVAIV
jgi:hypothetical protein